jgi:UDP-N-acetylglucosamine 2-epimerase (non-hydrolysing)
MKFVLVSGARPNYMKIAPIVWAIRRFNRRGEAQIQSVLVHTGQHYDPQLFDVFFRELDLPAPDYSLDVGSGSHTYQTARVMERLEPILQQERPDLVVVVGDVNSTVAAALTAAKLGIPLAHIEAGLRSFDRTMPEEINRMVTDTLSDYLFVTEESGKQNLLREGVDAKKIFFVGNVMIDSLQQSRHLWECSTVHETLGVRKGEYGVVTLHRPANVDDGETLHALMQALAEVSKRLPIIFPVHPRTRKRLESLNGRLSGLRFDSQRVNGRNLYCVEPLGYLDFMALIAGARIVLTDSGGIQEETTFLNIPCLTLRENTERPVTVTHGTNRVIGTSPAAIVQEAARILERPLPTLAPPPLWEGQAAERIVSVLLERLGRDEPGS